VKAVKRVKTYRIKAVCRTISVQKSKIYAATGGSFAL
jgi:hypothetical protein